MDLFYFIVKQSCHNYILSRIANFYFLNAVFSNIDDYFVSKTIVYLSLVVG